MKRQFDFSPAAIDRRPDPNKYYGVTSNDDFSENGGTYTSPTRAFIASWSGYPNPTSFVMICADKMTAGNTRADIEAENNKHAKMSLEAYIINLCQKKWKVYEFTTAKELFAWLGQCEDKPKDER